MSNTNPKHKAEAELPAGINPKWFGQLTILNKSKDKPKLISKRKDAKETFKRSQ